MNWINDLKKLAHISRRLVSLARLSRQSLEQNEVDEDIRATALGQLWQKRGSLAGEMLKISRKLQPVWHSWPECLRPLAQEEHAQALAWIRQIREDSDEITELDAYSKAALNFLLEEARQELLEFNHKNKVMQAYRPTVLSNPQHCLPAQLSRTT